MCFTFFSNEKFVHPFLHSETKFVLFRIINATHYELVVYRQVRFIFLGCLLY